MAFTIYTFIVLLVVHKSLQKSSPTKPTYRAAVVEFNTVLYEDDAPRTLYENVVKMENFIEQAATEEADIIVFPELTPTATHPRQREEFHPWTTKVPAPWQRYAPCGNNDTSISDYLRQLACAAKRYKIYVAINILEEDNCTGKKCRPDGLYYYATSVVFDREGVIIGRCRKFNLHEYSLLDVLNEPEMLTFTTDFGVTFSYIICFDIMFQKPWVNVIRKENVTDFIFQTAWPTKLPYMTGVQLQSSWSYIEDINLLASGLNWAKEGYSGSGIYAGRQGILTATIGLEDYEELLVADVPKKVKAATGPLKIKREKNTTIPNEAQGYQIGHESFHKNDAKYFRLDHFRLDQYTTNLITKNGSVAKELRHNGLRCKFNVNVTNLISPATYRLVAFEGSLFFGEMVSVGIKICSIVSCTDVTHDSCVQVHNSSTIFQSIEIAAVHVDHENTTMTPNSLRSNLFPLGHWFFEQHKEEGKLHTFMYLTKPTQGLITFGVWGRNYDDYIYHSGNGGVFCSKSGAFSQILGLSILAMVLRNLLL